ncbi:unnamed protein product [Hermetia illucens]|uniref:CN hydrolase domain-containing protein n=2 Tax=Hermetia illucens TaxID=343691 RepID=A0A7R8UUP0_HERIL|nr:unnamed protein product [Hermetia illucens]
MSKFWTKFRLLVLFVIFSDSDQASTPDSLTYVAGVVEFNPPIFKYRNETSAPEYRNIIFSKEAEDVDIMVFPEMTLNTVLTTTFVPDPKLKIVPCDNADYEEFLSSMSCTARDSRKYLVINVIEKATCTNTTQESIGDPRPCSSNGLNSYNTNVVFDRNGAVISRYRKWNLFGELGRNTTYKPEYGVFDTDFGVRFGHFICFDILFYTPAQEIVSSGVTDFVFPTMWFSELPFLTAVQVQSAWAYTNDVNLLAAGANNAAVGSTGTGIYAGKQGTIVATMTANPLRKLFVATVPKKGSNLAITPSIEENDIGSQDLFLKRDHIESYNTSIVDTSSEIVRETLCHEDLCCDFIAVIKNQTVSGNSSSYTYRLTVYDGNRSYSGAAEGSLKICSIMACTNATLASCGRVFTRDVQVENTFIFQDILIEGKFRNSGMLFVMPNSLDFTYMPVKNSEYYLNKQEYINHTYAQISLTQPRANLLTFGIYVNVLNKTESGDTASSAKLSLLALLASSIFVLFINGNLIR